MAEQLIIQAAISSVEMFDRTKSMFKSCTTSVKNAAQISKQDILCIAFIYDDRITLTLAHKLRNCLPMLMWKDLESKLETIQYLLTIMPPKLIYNKALMSYLRCTYFMPVTCCQKDTTWLTWLKSLQKV